MSYEYAYNMDESAAIGMVVFWVIYALLICAWGIAAYVLRSLGVYTIAKRRGIRHPWMAWVPVVDHWLLGCISDQYQYVVKGKNKSKRKVLLVLDLAMVALYVVLMVCALIVVIGAVTEVSENEIYAPAMGMLGSVIPMMGIAIALMVFRYMALYDLYTSCSPQNNVLFLVLSILFNVTEPFFIFFNRKKDDGMPPRRPEPQDYIPDQPRYEPPQEPWDGPKQI